MVPDNYSQLLEETYKKIKPIESKAFDRFEIPKVNIIFQGKKTIINNFKQICSYVRRDYEHIMKFLLRELATSGNMDSERLVLHSRRPAEKINNKVEDYAREFVICKECGKPDTAFIKQEGFLFVHCLACGAKRAVRSKIQ